MRVAACIETLFDDFLGITCITFGMPKQVTQKNFFNISKKFCITELRRKAPLRIDGVSLQNAFKGNRIYIL